MTHSFEIEVANQYGVNCALLLHNIYFWTEKNRANNQHIHDGKAWTYNSTKAFAELFPYMSERQIKYAISTLEEEGIIESNNFNEVAYDRTKWYAITDKGYSLVQNCPIERTNLSNGLDTIVQPIPYINTYINTDICEPSEIDFEELWIKTFDNYPKKGHERQAQHVWVDLIKIKSEEEERVELARDIYKATSLYVDDYLKSNPEDKAYKYMPCYDNWLNNESATWIRRLHDVVGEKSE